MTQTPKFEIGALVYKWTGDYGGPGRVRGITALPDGKLRYLVGHRIEGGRGEFLHIYSAGNLRDEEEALDDLPTITKEEGLRLRTGLVMPELSDEQTAELKQALERNSPGPIIHLSPVDTPDTELLDALQKAHEQVDMLMAMVIGLDKTFMPSQSPLWPEIVRRVELIRKHEVQP